MDSKDLKEEILEAFLIALDEKLDKRNTYTNRDIGDERREFKRAGIPLKKVAKGRGVTLPNLKGVDNTEGEWFDADTTQGRMRQWARTMQSTRTDPNKGKKSKKVDRVTPSKEDRKKSRDQRRAVHTQVKKDTDRPSAISTDGKGNSTLLAGNTRATLRRVLGKPIKAHMFKEQIRNAVLNYLEEGIKSGGDVEASADRLGKWFKGINPNAKPGKEGYMRKRNVPPTDPDHPGSKYDATKHKPQEEGKPLEYMKPQHKDYTIANINTKIDRMAIRKAERDTPIPGSIQKRHKEKMARKADQTKKGRAILKKHGVPNPSVPEMAVKWEAGNRPKTKDNPEGYVRSDEERSKDDPMNPFKEQIKNAVLNYLKEDDAQPPSAHGSRHLCANQRHYLLAGCRR